MANTCNFYTFYACPNSRCIYLQCRKKFQRANKSSLVNNSSKCIIVAFRPDVTFGPDLAFGPDMAIWTKIDFQPEMVFKQKWLFDHKYFCQI